MKKYLRRTKLVANLWRKPKPVAKFPINVAAFCDGHGRRTRATVTIFVAQIQFFWIHVAAFATDEEVANNVMPLIRRCKRHKRLSQQPSQLWSLKLEVTKFVTKFCYHAPRDGYQWSQHPSQIVFCDQFFAKSVVNAVTNKHFSRRKCAIFV